jgi:carboxylesterase type B
MRLASEWVYKNIGGFGGDPSRITIMGQGGTAKLLDMYAYAWPLDPIAQAFILQYGNEMAKRHPPAAIGKAWPRVAKELGCDQGDEFNVLKCMRSKTYVDIMTAVDDSQVHPYHTEIDFTFRPSVDNITAFDNAEYTRRSQAGDLARIPILVGADHNKVEGREKHQDEKEFHDNRSETDYWCPAAQASAVRSQSQIPVWRYSFEAQPHPKLRAGGAPWDLKLIFNTYEYLGAKDKEKQRHTSAFMRSAWASFVKDPQYGLLSFDWPRFISVSKDGRVIEDTRRKTTLVIDSKVNVDKLKFIDVIGTPRRKGMDFDCPAGAIKA